MANSKQRSGLSIIEVLTSIVVAMIGVFGVLSMIPFSVKQAQSGLDRDAVTAVARNAIDEFQVRGFQIVSGGPGTRQLNWVSSSGRVQPEVMTGNPLEVFMIDPLGVVDAVVSDVPATQMANGGLNRVFPFNDDRDPGSAVYPPNLEIRVANLTKPVVGLVQFDSAAARQMFRTEDDLVFGDPEELVNAGDDLDGPTQIYDEGLVAGVATDLQRQTNGRISWCVLMVPSKNTGAGDITTLKNYRSYTIVFRGRSMLEYPVPDLLGLGVDSRMLTAEINRGARASTPVAALDVASPLSSVTLNVAQSLSDSDLLRRDDWVMLINRDADPTVQLGFRKQIAFARVTGIGTDTLTLDGPDFMFQNDKPFSGSEFGTLEPTHIVHLKNVIGVYERTVTLETASRWTAE